jgi:hypothetical protein
MLSSDTVSAGGCSCIHSNNEIRNPVSRMIGGKFGERRIESDGRSRNVAVLV